jgi:quinoprotein glucose dehydrogenase
VANSPRGVSYRRTVAGPIARQLIPACAALAALAWAPAAGAEDTPNSRFDYVGWDSYLGGSDSSQFSSLDQINRDNVNRLEVAWTYETGAGQPPHFNPTIGGGRMYVVTGDNHIAALDPATGHEIWKSNNTGRLGGRGVNYWHNADRLGRAAAAADRRLCQRDRCEDGRGHHQLRHRRQGRPARRVAGTFGNAGAAADDR